MSETVATVHGRRALHRRPEPSAASLFLADVRGSGVMQLALAMIAVQLVFRGWATYGAWFHIDDFNFISLMTDAGGSPGAATTSYFGHLMPAAMYLSWLNHLVAPWNWALPATELLLLQAACDVGLLVLLRSLFGVRPGILPPLALFLASAISIEPSIWWAAAINLLPLQVALFLGLSAHVAYLRRGRLRDAVIANAWILGGLAFNEKTALVYVVIGIFSLCYFASGRPVARVRQLVRDHRPGFTVYVATGAVYTGVYVAFGMDFSGDRTTGFPTLEVVRNMVKAYVTGIAGGPVEWWHIPNQPGSLALPSDPVTLLCGTVVVLVLVEILRHRRRAARALITPLLLLAVDTLLVLVARVSVAGALLSLTYRYQGELAAVSAIALGCAVLPILGAVESAEERSASELLDHPRRVAALVAGVSLLATYSSVGFIRHWQSDDQAERWFTGVLGALRAAPEPIPVADTTVNDFVTNGFRFPENAVSHILRGSPGYEKADFTTASVDQLYVLADTGVVEPALVTTVRRGLPGPVAGCGHQVQETDVSIPLDGPVAYGGWWVRMGVISSRATSVRLTTNDVSHSLALPAGVHAIYVEGAGSFDAVTVHGQPAGVTLCTDDVTVGRLVPGETDSEEDR